MKAFRKVTAVTETLLTEIKPLFSVILVTEGSRTDSPCRSTNMHTKNVQGKLLSRPCDRRHKLPSIKRHILRCRSTFESSQISRAVNRLVNRYIRKLVAQPIQFIENWLLATNYSSWSQPVNRNFHKQSIGNAGPDLV